MSERQQRVEHLLDFAGDTLTTRLYDSVADDTLLAAFVGDAVAYLKKMGVSDIERTHVYALVVETRALRRHVLLRRADAPLQSPSDGDIEEQQLAGEQHIEAVLDRVRTSIRTRLLDSSYLDESIADQNFYSVSVHVRYNASVHKVLISDLKRLYSPATARLRPLRPYFLAPFMVNHTQVTDERQDVSVRLFFVFNTNPAPLLEARRLRA